MPKKKKVAQIKETAAPVKNIKVSSFGDCADRSCDCHTHMYRKHCLQCKKLMKGMTVIQNELCPECTESNGRKNLSIVG